MLLEFEFELLDRRMDSLPSPLPQPNWNDALTCKPSEESRQMTYKRREQAGKS